MDMIYCYCAVTPGMSGTGLFDESGHYLGILLGGVAAQWGGYHAAFWMAWAVNAAGVAFFYLYASGHYRRNKLA